MRDDPECRRFVEALVDATARDPFRARDDLLSEVARVLGEDIEVVRAQLPEPGMPAWVRSTGPRRIAQGGGFALDDVVATADLDSIRVELDSSDRDLRRRAVDRLMIAGEGVDAHALVLRALADPEPTVRLAAVPGAWLFRSNDVGARLRELASGDPDTDVRSAAIARLGLDENRDPETVKALMATVEGDDIAVGVRAAAVTALGRCGRGYARVPSIIRAQLSWSPDAVVRSAALRASCLLTTTAEADDFVAHAVPVLSRHPGLAGEHQRALRDLADRVPAVVRALEGRAADVDPHSRRACAVLTGAMVTPSDTDRARLLARLAVDEDDEVRAAAVRASSTALARMTGSDRQEHPEVAAALEGCARA